MFDLKVDDKTLSFETAEKLEEFKRKVSTETSHEKNIQLANREKINREIEEKKNNIRLLDEQNARIRQEMVSMIMDKFKCSKEKAVEIFELSRK